MIPIIREEFFEVSDGHKLFAQEAGTVGAEPVIFLHGGPGGRISDISRSFFDDRHHVLLFDQRGSGRSMPFLSLENNTISASVEDIELLREKMHWDTMTVFGGSYGSTLALAYAIKYPHRVNRLVLRGIFLGRQSDVAWLFQKGASEFYPEEFESFKCWIPDHEQHDLVSAYYQRMIQGNEATRWEAMKRWNDWENSIVQHIPPKSLAPFEHLDQSMPLLEAHYFANKMFWQEDNYILEHISSVQSIPMDIVHGRYDVDCRVSGAYELAKACPHANLHIIEAAGHSPYDAAMFHKLQELMHI